MSTISPEPAAIRIHRVCPLLERATETRFLPYAPEPWLLRQCLETGFVYLENPPEYASFETEFAWEVTKEKESQRRSADEPWFYAFRVWFRDTRVRIRCRNRKVIDLAAAWIRSQPTEQLSLVELGCGNGENLQRIMAMLPTNVARHCIPQGVELSTQLAREADEVLNTLGGSCLHHHALGGLTLFPDASQDLIILANFLEHEINPLPLLRLCRDKLKPSGRIIVKVPNYDCLSRHLRGARWCGFRWPDHVNYFTPRTLKQMAELAGLTIARMGLTDRSPLNDNMYAILRLPDVASSRNNVDEAANTIPSRSTSFGDGQDVARAFFPAARYAIGRPGISAWLQCRRQHRHGDVWHWEEWGSVSADGEIPGEWPRRHHDLGQHFDDHIRQR